MLISLPRVVSVGIDILLSLIENVEESSQLWKNHLKCGRVISNVPFPS